MIERPARRDDLDAVLDLFCRYEERYRGFPDSDPGDITEDWDADGWDFARDSLVLEDEGRVVGYALVIEEHSDTVVDPDRYERALSERLVAFVEGHDRHVEHYVPDGDPGMHAVLRDRGWTPARRLWRMRIELSEPVPEPRWPAGVAVRSYRRPQDDEAVHRVITEAFREIGGQHERTLDAWRGFLLDTERFDADLYLVAETGGEVVGACLSQVAGGEGFVRQLAVAPSQRGHGLGIALLHEAFRRHVARGCSAAVLGVDAANPTGAIALYEKAGMRVQEQFTRWDWR